MPGRSRSYERRQSGDGGESGTAASGDGGGARSLGGKTDLVGKNSTAVESLVLYLYTAHHVSMSRTDLRAQAAVPVYRRSRLCPPLPPPRG